MSPTMQTLVVDADRVSRKHVALLIARLGGPPPVFVDDPQAPPAGDWALALVGVGTSVRELQTLREGLDARTPLVAMTTQDSDATRRACLQAGADEVLVKPLTREALAAVVLRAAPDADDFDAGAWAGLRELFGVSGAARLCTTLVEDLPVQRSRLADALRDDDCAALKRLAHTLRGVSQQLGAGALARQWALAEHAATAGDAATALQLSAGLMDRHAALVERLRHECAST